MEGQMAAPVQRIAPESDTQFRETVSDLDHVFRLHAAQILATLTRFLGPGRLTLAEDALQETMIRALHQWAYRGAPDNPRAWLLTVAKRRALDILRREQNLHRKHDDITRDVAALREDDPVAEVIEWLDDDLRDDQLKMLFICCHPALSRESRVTLTLKTLGGLGVSEIARAFLTSEATIAQRIVRAKRTIRERQLSFVVPDRHALPDRLDSVLDVLYLLFNEGYSAHQGDDLIRHELCAEAIRITTILADYPIGDVPRVHALLALMQLQASRLPARLDADGDILQLEEQDRTLWDRRLIHAGITELTRSAAGDTVSTYHLQAGIAAIHTAAPDYGSTDWLASLEQYDDLLRIAPSPVIALNRSVAVAMVAGPDAALDALEQVRSLPGMDSYYLFHATVAEMHRRTGHISVAAHHYHRARILAKTAPEQRFLDRKIAELAHDDHARVAG